MRIILTALAWWIGTVVAAATASADLLVDQVGATSTSGGLGTPVIQSFKPARNNVAAVEVSVIGTAVLTSDLTVELIRLTDEAAALDLADESGLTVSVNEAIDEVIATKMIPDVPRGTRPTVVFDQPVAVAPERFYFLRFTLDGLVIGTQRSSPSPYDRGAVFQGGGNFSGGDVNFTTLYDDAFIPEPTSLALLGGLGCIVGRRRRR